MGEGRRNRLEALIGIALGAIALLVLGYAVWGYRLGPAAQTLPTAAANVPPTATPVLIALWDAYGQARAAAQAQAQDVQLVSAATQWQTASERAFLEGAANWSFVFYSPASGSALDVVVGDGAAQVVNQTRVWIAPQALAAGAWQDGPRDALLVFLAYGGRAFLEQHPQAVVDLHLGRSEGGSVAWSVVALDAGGEGMLALVIDAETGQVLSVAP